MTTLAPYPHPIEPRAHISWTTTQENALSTDYPFDIVNETCDLFLARTYLQFLWLPESIMPLSALVPSLERINAPSTSSNASVHPVHALIEPLLLHATSITNKYQKELPEILNNGGGAGEMEEVMMWYAISHEKENGITLNPGEDDIWSNEKWRAAYLDRMERREVMIQILLYLFKFSLPGPPPAPEAPKKKKRSKEPPPPTLEDNLETLMDRLSVWQLLGSLDPVPQQNKNGKDTRDWMQQFTEDLVEKQFLQKQPEACALLRSKVFPSSPFSDAESDTPTEPALSPPRKPTISKHPLTKLSKTGSSTNKHDARTLQRVRSRSLSVTLAQDQEERAKGLHRAGSKKPILNREVSMSRVFKPKHPAPPAPPPKAKPKPQEASPSSSQASQQTSKRKPDLGVTLVEETPVKPRIGVLPAATMDKPSQPVFGPTPPPAAAKSKGLKRAANELDDNDDDDDDDDDHWMVDSSPVIHTLQTPTKQKRSKRTPSVDVDDLGGVGDNKSAGSGTAAKASAKGSTVPSKARPGRKKRS